MKTAKNKILFIINPKSGVKKHDNIIGIINETLDKKLFEPDFVSTKRANHATELALNASKNNIDIVVAVGGDGTIREIAKALVNSNTKLAIIPCGSGNGFAFHFKIPTKVYKAIEIINKQKTLLIDTAKINDEYFGNIAGVGFDAQIAWKFSNSNKRGLFSYLKIIFKEFFRYKQIVYDFKLDNKTFSKKAFLVSIANGSQFGNNAYINPEASTTDGLLEICILKRVPIALIPIIAIKLLNKQLHTSKYLEIHKTKKAIISNEKLHIAHIDGDPIETNNEIIITINPSSLHLITP